MAQLIAAASAAASIVHFWTMVWLPGAVIGPELRPRWTVVSPAREFLLELLSGSGLE